MTEKTNNKNYFHEGAITPEMISKSIAKHSSKTSIGAHQIFLGQVRADEVNGKSVKAIEYSAYIEMANNEISKIREEIITNYHLTCAHVTHSQGLVNVGEICFFVFVSSAHRQAAFDACAEMVNRIKKEVPIFGKEIFEDETHQWKENKI